MKMSEIIISDDLIETIGEDGDTLFSEARGANDALAFQRLIDDITANHCIGGYPSARYVLRTPVKVPDGAHGFSLFGDPGAVLEWQGPTDSIILDLGTNISDVKTRGISIDGSLVPGSIGMSINSDSYKGGKVSNVDIGGINIRNCATSLRIQDPLIGGYENLTNVHIHDFSIVDFLKDGISINAQNIAGSSINNGAIIANQPGSKAVNISHIQSGFPFRDIEIASANCAPNTYAFYNGSQHNGIYLENIADEGMTYSYFHKNSSPYAIPLRANNCTFQGIIDFQPGNSRTFFAADKCEFILATIQNTGGEMYWSFENTFFGSTKIRVNGYLTRLNTQKNWFDQWAGYPNSSIQVRAGAGKCKWVSNNDWNFPAQDGTIANLKFKYIGPDLKSGTVFDKYV
jgi:hypothetical protein